MGKSIVDDGRWLVVCMSVRKTVHCGVVYYQKEQHHVE